LRIVLAGLDGGTEISELCRREGISAIQYYNWKHQLVQSADQVYGRAKGKQNRAVVIELEYVLRCNPLRKAKASNSMKNILTLVALIAILLAGAGSASGAKEVFDEKVVSLLDTLEEEKDESLRKKAVEDLVTAIAQYWWTPEDYLRILLGGRDEQGINSDKEA
jgi:transposase-like protein